MYFSILYVNTLYHFRYECPRSIIIRSIFSSPYGGRAMDAAQGKRGTRARRSQLGTALPRGPSAAAGGARAPPSA